MKGRHQAPPSGELELSALVIVGSERERAQETIDALGEQSARERIEAVVLDTRPELSELRVPPGLEARLIASPEGTLAAWRTAAVRASRAPIVALIEDHATPEPSWAEAVIDAFADRPRGAVSYAFKNANPGSWVSRAGFICDYLAWIDPISDPPPGRLPCNNIAYRRDLLLERSERLETLLSSDVVMQEDLRAAGHELFVERRALVYHENCESLRDLVLANFHHCRLIADGRVRARGLGPAARLGFAIGVALLVAPLKLARDVSSLRGRRGLGRRFAMALPIVVLVHFVSAVGESIGYLAVGNSTRRFAEFELDVERSSTAGGA